MTQLQPTNATEWRRAREQGIPVELPSGFVARLRPVGLLELMKRGRIPDLLTGIAAETVALGRPTEMTIKEQANNLAEMLEIICTSAFMEPCIVPEDQDLRDGVEEIHFFDVPFNDQLWVLDFVSAPTRALRSFREQQAEPMEPVDTGENDKPAPKRNRRRS